MKTSANTFEFREQIPKNDEYYDLFETTGWNKNYRFDKADLVKAIENSWFAVSVYKNVKLIGFGRVISDGIHHALIVDLMVHPDFRKHGIGSKILNMLTDKCKSNKVRDIQLFSAAGKSGFYEKYGFRKRADNAPGMQLI